ncbi:hypothetical protein AK830_g11140 [Neonectria ditissima]|uniref:Peptidase S8/S53 domain-containing protein n=1 Tax=Neonectria ditissima TaxID=78410 RepID=A0A0P7B242_9HYPO|nr:hypothetical protein AK830_g11140 [Neonectria ditissima]
MDEFELWMSDDEDMDDQQSSSIEDATFFKLELKYQGADQRSQEYRLRNKPGQKQREAVSGFVSGSRKKPAFAVSCTAKAIIHGTLDQVSRTRATLLIYDFCFFSYRSTRIKEADIWFEFRPKKGSTSAGPTVHKIEPFAKYDMMPTTEIITRSFTKGGGITSGTMVSANATVSATTSVEKTTTHAAELVGNNPSDEWGNRFLAHWFLKENESQKSGIVSFLRTCILLTRQNDEEFSCMPSIEVTPDFKTWLVTLAGSRTPDDPIILDPEYDAYNMLEGGAKIDELNLGSVKLDDLWHYKFGDAVSPAGCNLFGHRTVINFEIDVSVSSPRFKASPSFSQSIISPSQPKIMTIVEPMQGLWDVSDNEISEGELDQSSVVIGTASRGAGEGDKAWRAKELDRQCVEVMEDLRLNKRRWEESIGPNDVPVLEDYKKTTLAQRRTYDEYAPTALHIFAKGTDKAFSRTPKNICMKVIRYLLEHRYNSSCDLYQGESGKEELVLKIAMKHNNDGFLDCVLECWPEKAPDLLNIQDSDGKNCIHHVFDWPFTSKQDGNGKERFLDRAQKLAAKARANTLAAMDRDGNTPIHYAMHYRQCRGRPDQYVEMVKEMIRKGDEAMRASGTASNKRGESLIHYCRHTNAEFMGGQKSQVKKETRHTAKDSDNHLPIRNTKDLPLREGKKSRLHADEVKSITFEEQTRNLFETPRYPDKFGIRHQNTASLQISMPPLELQIRKEFPQMPQPLRRVEHGSFGEDEAKGKEGKKLPARKPLNKHQKCAQDLLEFLTKHYIRTRSDLEARNLIYEKQSSDMNKNLYFDASGKEDAGAIIELLNRMEMGGFAETLSYVYLPTVLHVEPQSQLRRKNYEANSGRAVSKSLRGNNKPGRDILVDVFNKLHQLGVRSILRLCVEDRDPPSHSDASIEKAIRGSESLLQTAESRVNRPISVETWDWRKPDLSIDVIEYAAPTVEQINLYWSGNQAVLRAWSCLERIPRLYTTTARRLKKVTVYAAPGLETRERMDNSLRRFEQDIRSITSCPEIQVEIHHRMEGLFTKQDMIEEVGNSSGGQVDGKQHVWVKRMEEFRGALAQTLGLKEIDVKRIKVALIDDGVELSSLDTYNNTVKASGLSYCPRSDRGAERPWHRSNTGHGTIMANMIVRLNPWVSLYVMRVQDGKSLDGERTIYAESAARAIRGAIDLGVNIISMSWTVKQKVASTTGQARNENGASKLTAEEMHIKELQEAIDAAVEARILMFCSASDDLQASSMDSLPFRQRPGYIFRIGAAHADGRRSSYSEDKEKIDYFFPGNQVAEAWNPRSSDTVKYHDGSSVSTALAAGLASLIMYCAAISGQYQTESKPAEFNRYVKLVDALQDRDNMKRAFDNIEDPKHLDRKFLPAWEVFGPVADRMKQERDRNKKMDELIILVSDLCTDFNDITLAPIRLFVSRDGGVFEDGKQQSDFCGSDFK